MVHTAGPRDSSTIPVSRLVAFPRPVPIPRPAPRATLLNMTVTVGGVEITLLSYVVVEHCLRLYGALRVMADHDPILATVPVLELTRVGGEDPFHSVGASVVPQPRIVWLAWLFEFAHSEPGPMTAVIERVELGFRIGRKTEGVVGPWMFEGIPDIAIEGRAAPRPDGDRAVGR